MDRFFTAFKQDGIIKYMIQTGLLNELVAVHENITAKMYQRLFYIDLLNQHDLMKIYKQMGIIVGMMLFLVKYPRIAEPHALGREVGSLLN